MTAVRRAFAWVVTSPPETTEDDIWWTRQDGSRIRIVDMHDNHLRNTIFFANKQYGKHRPDSPRSPAELWPVYQALLKEAQRRNLSWI